jgi:tetratricopeptide (TPR) repeat protein
MMLRQSCRSRLLRLLFILIGLLFSLVGPSWVGSNEEELCNVAADFPAGARDYLPTIKAHLKLLRAHDDNALAHYHLGFAYGMTGRTQEEISEYREAKMVGLSEWDLSLKLGLAYLDQNDTSNAVEALETAVRQWPDHPKAHLDLVIAYRDGRRLHEALKQISVALQLAPPDLDAGNTKPPLICAELGDISCAQDERTYLVRVAPGCLPARTNLLILKDSRHSPASPSAVASTD